jgi:hypothetical protein
MIYQIYQKLVMNYKLLNLMCSCENIININNISFIKNKERTNFKYKIKNYNKLLRGREILYIEKIINSIMTLIDRIQISNYSLKNLLISIYLLFVISLNNLLKVVPYIYKKISD